MEQLNTSVQALLAAMPRMNSLAGKTIVVKVGGSTLGSHDTALEDIVALTKLGIRIAVVHGGGTAISSWLKVIGKEGRFINGLRVTDVETMEVVTMVLAGKVNKDIVASLVKLGGQAVGVSGLDGGLIRARQISPELDLVGDVTDTNVSLVNSLFALGYVPVIAPIAMGEQGESLNINADTAAAEVAVGLRAEKIIFLTDIVGICDRDKNLLPHLTVKQAQELIDTGVISGGMIPKAQACFRALHSVKGAHIIDGRVDHALIRELFTEHQVGTTIVK